MMPAKNEQFRVSRSHLLILSRSLLLRFPIRARKFIISLTSTNFFTGCLTADFGSLISEEFYTFTNPN